MAPSMPMGAVRPSRRKPHTSGGGLPMTVWNGRPATLARRRTAPPPGHVGSCSDLIDKDELGRLKVGLHGSSGLSPCGYVITLLLTGVRRLFFNVMPWRRKNSCRVLMAKVSPRSLRRRCWSSARVTSGVWCTAALRKSACASMRLERRSPPQGFAWVRLVLR